MDRSQRLASVDRLLPRRRHGSLGPRGRGPGHFAARGLRSLPALLVLLLLLASCQGDADFGPFAPTLVTLSADEFRPAIVAIDRLVFEEGPVDAARRSALSAQLDALAGRVKSYSDSRFLALEALELRRLAAGAKDLPPGAPPPALANEWMRIRSNLFEDQSWFARSAADLERPGMPITPSSGAPVTPPPATPAAGPAPAPSSPAADLPVAVRGLMSELDARGSSYPQPARLVAIGEQLLPYGAAARPAAAPLANWLRYYSYSSIDPSHEALLRRLGSIVRALDPGASYYGDRRFQYGPDKSDQDRARTITFLFYGPLPRERVVPVFVAAMADPEEWIRDLAAAGLVQYGEPVPADPRPFSERVVSTSLRASEGALAEFRSLDASAKAQRIRSLLASGNERDASAVGRLYDWEQDPLIRTALLDALADPIARRGSLTVLLDTRIAVPGDRVPFLLAGMADEQPEVREAAKRTLLLCGPTPRVLVPMLIAALESGPPAQRKSAAAALKELTERDFGLDAETWRLWREAKLEGEPPQLLLPGPHHGSEVPLNADGAWWAICGPKGRRELKQVPVSIRLVHDAVLDAASEETGAEAVARGCEEPLAFLRNVAGLTARALTEGTVLPVRGGVAPLRYGTEDLEVRRVRTGESGFRIELHSAGRTQTLFAAETGFSGDPEPWSVSWVGDLDGDGRADLLLEASEDENAGQTFLFLSRPAPPGVPLKLVATHCTVGC